VRTLLILLFLSFLSFPDKGLAGDQSEVFSDEGFSVQIISAVSRFDKSPVKGMIFFKLEEGYRLLWRTPGEIGEPAIIKWDESYNLEKVELNWPAPKRFDNFGVNSFGYDENVLLPVTFYIEDLIYELKLVLEAEFFICANVCKKHNVKLKHHIPGSIEDKSPMAGVVNYAHNTLPIIGDIEVLKIENLVLGPDALVAVIYSENGFENLDLFVEHSEFLFISPPEVMIDKNNPKKANVRIKAPLDVEDLVKAITGSDIVLTLVVGDMAIEKSFSL
jgi:suppressor for copper-sensitivity B